MRGLVVLHNTQLQHLNKTPGARLPCRLLHTAGSVPIRAGHGVVLERTPGPGGQPTELLRSLAVLHNGCSVPLEVCLVAGDPEMASWTLLAAAAPGSEDAGPAAGGKPGAGPQGECILPAVGLQPQRGRAMVPAVLLSLLRTASVCEWSWCSRPRPDWVQVNATLLAAELAHPDTSLRPHRRGGVREPALHPPPRLELVQPAAHGAAALQPPRRLLRLLPAGAAAAWLGVGGTLARGDGRCAGRLGVDGPACLA